MKSHRQTIHPHSHHYDTKNKYSHHVTDSTHAQGGSENRQPYTSPRDQREILERQREQKSREFSSTDSTSSRPRGLQRQRRLPEPEIITTFSDVNEPYPGPITQQVHEEKSFDRVDSSENKDYLELPLAVPFGWAKRQKGFLEGERQSITNTQLVDFEGNVLTSGNAIPQRRLSNSPATRVKYPGIAVPKSPSGFDPFDTNEYYKYRSRNIPKPEIKDYRYDSGEALNINVIDDKTSIRSSSFETGDVAVVDSSAYNSINTNKGESFGVSVGPEEIQLKRLDINNTGDSKESAYKAKFKERIRLKSGSSQKSDDKITDKSFESDTGTVKSVHASQESDIISKVVGFPEYLRSLTLGKDSRQAQSTDTTPKSSSFAKERVEKSRGADLTTPPRVIPPHVYVNAVLLDRENESKFLTVEQPKGSSVVVASRSQNRLHNQSSTETSGLGETITSGCSSQESIPGYYSKLGAGNYLPEEDRDQGIDLSDDGETTVSTVKEGNSTFGKQTIDSDNIINHTNEQKQGGSLPAIRVNGITTPALVHTANQTSSRSQENERLASSKCDKKEKTSSGITAGPMRERGNIQIPVDTFKVRAYKPPPDFIGKDVKKPETLRVHSVNVGPNFDELFNQSKLTNHTTTVGLRLEQINNEWNRQNRGSSIKSRSSQGSFRSRAGSTRRSRRFLGHKESKWMKWGEERRASYRRRMEKLQQPEPDIPRASTPVKKARQEGLVFIHPDLESKYISEEDINYINRHKHERLKAYKLIEKSKQKHHHGGHDLNRLTAGELLTLSRYWDHRVFCRSRYISILLSLATTVIYILSICSTQWVTYPSMDVPTSYAHEGLWSKCSPVLNEGKIIEQCETQGGKGLHGPPATAVPARNLTNRTGPSPASTSMDFECGLWENYCIKLLPRPADCVDKIETWQTAVIGLMIFSTAFGFVAAILGICGVCTSPLPKKIYYFHSAGEIFFVCALSSTIALIVYAVEISIDVSIQSHTYGSGYGLGWGGTAFFYTASFCMSLDELVRESAQNKCCRYICWRSRHNDDNNSHPV